MTDTTAPTASAPDPTPVTPVAPPPAAPILTGEQAQQIATNIAAVEQSDAVQADEAVLSQAIPKSAKPILALIGECIAYTGLTASAIAGVLDPAVSLYVLAGAGVAASVAKFVERLAK